MHSLIAVVGPATEQELHSAMHKFGPDALVKSIVAQLEGLSFDMQFRALHDMIRLHTGGSSPTYVIMDEEDLGWIDARALYNSNITVAITYKDSEIAGIYDIVQDKVIYDWYQIGGRWYNHLKGKLSSDPLYDETIKDIIQAEPSWVFNPSLASVFGPIPKENLPVGYNSLKNKDIDWDKMVAVSVTEHLEQYGLIEPFMNGAKTLGTLLAEHPCDYKSTINPYSLFYAQIEGIPSESKQRCWAMLALVGYTREQVTEFAELRVYSQSGAIINGEWLDADHGYGDYNFENMRKIRDHIKAHPEEVYTIVDIHN